MSMVVPAIPMLFPKPVPIRVATLVDWFVT